MKNATNSRSEHHSTQNFSLTPRPSHANHGQAAQQGFQPAYHDNATGKIHLSLDEHGNPAKIHLLQGLPSTLIIRDPENRKVLAIKDSVVAGFVKDGQFYTRSQAALLVKNSTSQDHE